MPPDKKSSESDGFQPWRSMKEGFSQAYDDIRRSPVREIAQATVQAAGGFGRADAAYDSMMDTSLDYGSNTSPSDHASHGKPQFGEDGNGGRYPQGVDPSTGQPVAQSSTGPPYEVNNPEKKVDPNQVDWPKK